MTETLLILGILGILSGSVVTFYALKTRTFTPAYKDSMIQDLNLTIEHLKKRIQALNGTVGNMKAKQVTEIEIAPGEDPKGSIMEVESCLSMLA